MICPSRRPVRFCSSSASSSSVSVRRPSSASNVPSWRQGKRDAAAEVSTVMLIGTRGLVTQALPARDHADRAEEDFSVVTDEGPASERAQALDVGDIEVGVVLIGALRQLCEAGQARRDLVSVRDALRTLLLDELRRPRAWADEADVAAQDVPELRDLVEVPRLEDAASEPGQVARLRLEQPRVTGSVLEHVRAQRAELQQAEGAAGRDARLAVERPAAISDEDESEDRGEEEQQRRRDDDVEGAFGDWPRHGRIFAEVRTSCTSARPTRSPTRPSRRGSVAGRSRSS